MFIVIKASPEQKEALLAKGLTATVRVAFTDGATVPSDAAACFDLCYEEEGPAFAGTDALVFVNAVTDTLAALPPNAVRINAWSGFLERDGIEVVAADPQIEKVKQVLDTLGWRYHFAPDVPGMIAARVIAMIINEAYFGWGDGISSKQDIDTAMKLGTNYPYGPFEWSEKIGLAKIASLLQILYQHNGRYQPAPALLQALKS